MRCDRFVWAAMSVGVLAACEEEPTNAHETVVAAAIADADDVEGGTYITTDSTARLEVRFLDDDGDQIDGLWPEHDATLVLAPSGMATVQPDHDETGFYFVVTAGGEWIAGEAFVELAADGETEPRTFGPFEIEVAPLVGLPE